MTERKWGRRSQEVYDTLHVELRMLLDRYLREVGDLSLIEGHRGKEAQNRAYATGHSQLKWPDSVHNTLPSKAVDLQPYPRPVRDSELREQLSYIAGRLVQMAADEGLELRWGGDWDSDADVSDNRFDDLFHFELRG